MQESFPERYQTASYTSVEISPHLASAQAEKVLSDGKHGSSYQVLQQDATSCSLWDSVDQQPCVILLMEVLDNLPHDKSAPHAVLVFFQDCTSIIASTMQLKHALESSQSWFLGFVLTSNVFTSTICVSLHLSACP